LISPANDPTTTVTAPVPAGAGNDYGFGGSLANPDNRQHPLWRTEQLQHLMNLTTTRTHQYAVWITIGFFQVKRQGDQGMFLTNPQLAFDIMGPEIGAANGKNTRYRGFYLIDRLQLTGFNPTATNNFRQAIIYSNRIQ
jgi:large repetitive protein